MGKKKESQTVNREYRIIDGIGTRGETVTGKVVSDKMKHTVIVERDAAKYLSKYQRYARSRNRVVAHNPPSINAKVGDLVTVSETRKLSKTKAWMVVGINKREEGV